MATKQGVVDAVLSAASENSDLLINLSATMEAPSVYRAHVLHVQHLRATLKQEDQNVEKLRETVESQFKVHKNLRDSHIRRLYYRLTKMLLKFEEAAMTEERQYFEALEKQSKAELRQSELKRSLKQATEDEKPLEAKAKEHDNVHKRIDELYESIFAGYTPGFHQEDDRETSYYLARRNNDSNKERITSARRAKRALLQAQRNLSTADNLMKIARQESENEVFFSNSMSVLRRGNTFITYAMTSVEQAGQALRPLPQELAATQRHIMDFLRAGQKQTSGENAEATISTIVQNALVKLHEAREHVDIFIAQAQELELLALNDIRKTARSLEDSRQSLQEVRQGIFEQVAGFGEAAPAYMECCDRTDTFCILPEEPSESQAEADGLPEYQEPPRQTSTPPSSQQVSTPPAQQTPSPPSRQAPSPPSRQAPSPEQPLRAAVTKEEQVQQQEAVPFEQLQQSQEPKQPRQDVTPGRPRKRTDLNEEQRVSAEKYPKRTVSLLPSRKPVANAAPPLYHDVKIGSLSDRPSVDMSHPVTSLAEKQGVTMAGI